MPHAFCMSTMRYEMCETCHVVVHGEQPPAQEEWNAYLQDVKSNAAALRTLFVYTRGGGPNAGQRKQIDDLWPIIGKMPAIGLVTDSRIMRGILKAFDWIVPPGRARPTLVVGQSSEAEAVLNKLGLTLRERALVKEAVRRASVSLGVPGMS